MSPNQFLTRQSLCLFDVRLVECVDAEPFAERLGRVLPAQKFAAEVEGVGGKRGAAGGLDIRRRRVKGIVDNRHNAAAVFSRAFGDQLFDPMRERANLVRWDESQFVTT